MEPNVTMGILRDGPIEGLGAGVENFGAVEIAEF